MSYLEHRLILAFFECGLCYNVHDVSPKLALSPKLVLKENEPAKAKKVEKTSRAIIPNQAKPFRVKEFYFLTTTDYSKFRVSLQPRQKKEFLSMPHLRNLLRSNGNNSCSDIRYLTLEEIQEAHKNNLFYSPPPIE